jgi:hypothetical protein
MSRELEQRLERLLRAPKADQDVERRALELALDALPQETKRRRRPMRVVVLTGVTALVLLAVAAAALATAGALHVSLGPSPEKQAPPPRPAPQLHVPAGADAVAAVVDHELWLTTRSGLRIQGLPVRSATLSPRALYVAAGIGRSLVAMAPNGTRAWSHQAAGPVVAIAWAPDGLRIAYVVRRGGGFQLRTIEGNGIDDRLLDAQVRPVTPSWRADSLAVAYVGRGGRPVVYDFAHESHRLTAAETQEASQVAFAPEGATLAVASARRVWLAGPGGVTRILGIGGCVACGIAWVRGHLVVASTARSRSGSVLQLVRVTPAGRTVATTPLAVSGRVEALDANGSAVVAAVARPGTMTRLLASATASTGESRPLPEVLLQLPAGATIDAVSVR